ncbi:phenylalanine--tRNA ligase subunit alpha [Patescibacteria group bacterium]
MEDELKKYRDEALEAIAASDSNEALEKLRVAYLGRKGKVSLALRKIKDLSDEKKKVIGPLGNQIRQEIEDAMARKLKGISSSKYRNLATADWIDVSEPGIKPNIGSLHPISQVIYDLSDLFTSMGYEIVTGPEIETDYYCFEALNMPPGHPARDMQDTFYLENGMIPRTHTSAMQIRYMEKHKPPVRIIVPGRVYRNEKEDAAHTSIFTQLEGLFVDEKVTFANLKATLVEAVQKVAGKDKQLRFRPSFFPYTEPSAEIDMTCMKCNGKGCTLCGGDGWVELGGAGMVHPQIFANVGYDTSKIQGFAFGFGLDRIMSMKRDINDARSYYQNDLRFLRQF